MFSYLASWWMRSSRYCQRIFVVVFFCVIFAALTIVLVAYAEKVDVGHLLPGGAGTAGGEFAAETYSPAGVAVNETGNGGVSAGDVYVGDAVNNRIEEFSASGEFVRTWGGGVVKAGDPNIPSAQQAVDVDATSGSYTLTATTGIGTGTLTSGSPTVTAVVNTIGAFHVGDSVTETGIPTGTTITAVSSGTLTLSANATKNETSKALTTAETTTAITWNAEATILQADLAALAGIGSGNVTVAGGPGNGTGSSPYFVSFGGAWKETEARAMTSNSASVTVTQTNAGGVAGFDVCDTTATPADTAAECKEGTSESLLGEMQHPSGVAINQETGNVYVTNGNNARIDEFSAKGAFLRRWGWDVVKAGPDKASEQRAVTVSATGGTFTLSFAGSETTAIAYDAPALVVQSELEKLASIGTGNVTVTGGPGGSASTPYVVTFAGSLGGAVQPAITADTALLSGGAGSVTFTVTEPGATGFDVCNPTIDVCQGGTAGGGDGETQNSGDGQLAIEPGAPHNVYVADAGNRRITEYSSTGAFIKSFGWGVVSSGPDIAATSLTAATTSDSATLTAVSTVSGVVAVGSTLSGAGIPSGATVISSEPGTKTLVMSVAATESHSTESVTAAGGLEVCRAGVDLCKAGVAGSGSGQFGEDAPTRVAVDSNGDVYALDFVNDRVDKFTPSGETYTVSLFGAAQLETAPFAVAVEPVTNDVLIGRRATSSTSEMQVAAYSSSGALLETIKSGTDEGTANTALDGALSINHTNGDIYLLAASATTPEVLIFNNPPTPTPVFNEVADVTATSATFKGTVNPNGYPGGYHFEYSTNGIAWTSLPSTDVSVGEGSSPVSAEQTAGDLEPNTLYRVRLKASDSGTPTINATTAEKTFTTLAAKPTVFSVLASPVGETSANLTAYISPNNASTAYYIQYGTSTSYEHQIPAFERHIGAGGASIPVVETLTGLQPGTEYHFQVVATNTTAGLTGTGVTDGTPETFTTLNAKGSCPNELVRAESNIDPETGVPFSLQLPECRAYEIVSPGYMESEPAYGTGAFSGPEVSADGQRYFLNSEGVFAGSVNSPGQATGDSYEFTRNPSAGWLTSPMDPDATEYPATKREAISSNGSESLWEMRTSSQSAAAVSFYLRTSIGGFTEIGPAVPPSKTTGAADGENPNLNSNVSFVGASDNLSHILFRVDAKSEDYLWPNDNTVIGANGYTSLYEYFGIGHTGEGTDVPTLVGVDNEGDQISTCGTTLGAAETDDAHAVSGEGSTVFFTASAGGCVGGGVGPSTGQVFARTGAYPASATIVNVAGTSSCKTSDSCNVTAPVTYQGASANGSKVFFTAAQSGLVTGDTDATEALYECELPGDFGTQPTAVGKVNPCPSPVKAISLTSSGEGASVQGVVAISERGSDVYYVAKSVITRSPNAQGQTAQAGGYNLYVYEPESANPTQYKTAFVATLSAADSGDWTQNAAQKTAQTTPNGRFLVFASAEKLTRDDTSSVAQVFRYDAQSGELIRVSFGQNGFNDDGNTNVSTDAAHIDAQDTSSDPASGNVGAISNDGASIVFRSADALAPEAVAGNFNIYEYHAGNVSLIDGEPIIASALAEGVEDMFYIDGSGKDVFFYTQGQQLVGQDTDTQATLYDARIGGGFPAPPVAPVECKGEECQGSLTGTLSQVIPGSTGAPSVGNLTTPLVSLPPAAATVTLSVLSKKVKGDTMAVSVKTSVGGRVKVSGKYLTTASKAVAAGTHTVTVHGAKGSGKSFKRHKKTTIEVTLTVGTTTVHKSVTVKL